MKFDMLLWKYKSFYNFGNLEADKTKTKHPIGGSKGNTKNTRHPSDFFHFHSILGKFGQRIRLTAPSLGVGATRLGNPRSAAAFTLSPQPVL